MTRTMARHGILDVYEVSSDLLCQPQYLEDLLRTAAAEAQAHVLHCHMHHFGGQAGVTGVALLAESHISIHTWPEHAYAACDIFICGEMALLAARAVVLRGLKSEHYHWSIIQRG